MKKVIVSVVLAADVPQFLRKVSGGGDQARAAEASAQVAGDRQDLRLPKGHPHLIRVTFGPRH